MRSCASTSEVGREGQGNPSRGKRGRSTGIFAAFLLVTNVVGFLGSVPLLVFGFMYQLGARKLSVLLAASILASPLFAVIFGRLMEVPLPRGMGLMRLFSFYFY